MAVCTVRQPASLSRLTTRRMVRSSSPVRRASFSSVM
uniref:Uncharacterized protein n=1 Tax=Siphoviridae sp. ctBLh2 TaxID=2827803 RepID=A0A8S5S3L4_9CAUD|nr:MAG TPA: hypothetical protein [Siphoviridae sp. ctBLh2]